MLRFKIIALLSLVIFINGCGEKRKTIYEEFDFSTLPKSVISNGEKIYMRACFACHNTGREGATLLTETRQWNRTAKKGIEILYQNVLQGYTGMGGVATLLSETRQWNRTAKKGIEILYQNVLQGYTGMSGVMPPKGNCWDCTEDDIRQAILYIYHQVKLAKK